MKYVIQRDKKKSADPHKNFDEQSSLTLEKHRLSIAVVRDTTVILPSKIVFRLDSSHPILSIDYQVISSSIRTKLIN